MTNSNGRKVSVFRVVVKMVDGTALMRDCITQSEAKYWVENAVKVRLNNFPAVISRNSDERHISIDPAKVVYTEYRRIDKAVSGCDCNELAADECQDCPVMRKLRTDWIIIDSLLGRLDCGQLACSEYGGAE